MPPAAGAGSCHPPPEAPQPGPALYTWLGFAMGVMGCCVFPSVHGFLPDSLGTTTQFSDLHTARHGGDQQNACTAAKSCEVGGAAAMRLYPSTAWSRPQGLSLTLTTANQQSHSAEQQQEAQPR
jgi:hypothetical protein